MGIFSVLAGVVLVVGLEPSVAVAVIAGILVPLLGFVVEVMRRIHKRLSKLEEESRTREKVVYGGENNPLNLGLVKEIKSLKEDFEDYEKKQKKLEDEKEKLFDRLQALEKEIDDYESEKEDDDV